MAKGGITRRLSFGVFAAPAMLRSEPSSAATHTGLNYRATLAEAVGDLAVGDCFLCAETGALRVYRRIATAPYYEDQGGEADLLSRSFLALPSGAAQVGYALDDVSAQNRTIADKARESASVKDFGAIGDSRHDDQPAFRLACDNSPALMIPGGIYRIGTGRIGELQKPLTVRGVGHASVIVIDNPDDTAFRVGAVGGLGGDFRYITIWEGLTFKPKAGRPSPYAVTAIDAQAVHAVTAQDCVFLDLGPGAVKLKNIYYGYLQGLQFVNSGLSCNDVNSISLFACEFRANDLLETNRTAGKPLFGNVGRSPIELIDSDAIKFIGGLVEAWHCRVALLRGSHGTLFQGVWWEANRSAVPLIRLEQVQSLNFTNNRFDFGEPYEASFIHVDNRADRKTMQTAINFHGGDLILTSIPFGDAGPLVTTENNDRVRVNIGGDVTFQGGHLRGSRSVEFNVTSIKLAGPLEMSFYSRPNAFVVQGHHAWIPDGRSADWDFANGPNFDGTGLVARTTTARGEFLTGTRGVKITGFTAGSAKTFTRTTAREMGAIQDGSGDTYLVLIRAMFDRDVTVKWHIAGGFLDIGSSPEIPVKAGRWNDFILKTAAASTQAQGRFNPPTIKCTVSNASGADANAFVDFIDYCICEGDHSL